MRVLRASGSQRQKAYESLKILADSQRQRLEPNVIIMYVGSGMRACAEGIPLAGDFKAFGNNAVSKIGTQLSSFAVQP